MNWPRESLLELVLLSDSGTWGDEALEAEGFPVLRSTNVVGDRLSLADVAFRTIPAKDRDRKLLLDGDIIVTKSSGSPSHIGKCCLVEGRGDLYFSNFMLRLRADTGKVTPGWLHYWLSSYLGRRHVASASTTTTGLRNIDLNHYLAQRVPVPPLPEQHRLLRILSRARAIADARRESLALTDDLLRATFLEMFGDPITNPKNWDTAPLEGLLLEGPQNGLYVPASEYGSGTPIVRIDSYSRTVPISWQLLKRARLNHVQQRSYALGDGDVLINRVNTTELVGKSALVSGMLEPSVFESNMMRCRPDQTQVLGEYLLFELNSERVVRQIATRVKPAVNQASINQGDVLSLSIRRPPLSLQEQFVRALREIHNARAMQESALAESERLFASLQHRAFQGEL